MDHRQRGGEPSQGGQENDHDLGHIGGEQEEDKFADVVVNDPSLFHRRYDADIVIIGQHHVGGFLGHIRAGDAHGHTDVGTLDGRCIVDPIAGHGHHFAIGLQGIHDAHLVFRGNTGKDIGTPDLGLEQVITHPVEVRAGQHLVAGVQETDGPGNRARRCWDNRR